MNDRYVPVCCDTQPVRGVASLDDSPATLQFSLRTLLGFVTVCSILSALSALTGVVAMLFLMLLGLALGMRQGIVALAMLAAALLSAGASNTPASEAASLSQSLMVIFLSSALCYWRLPRRRSECAAFLSDAPTNELRSTVEADPIRG